MFRRSSSGRAYGRMRFRDEPGLRGDSVKTALGGMRDRRGSVSIEARERRAITGPHPESCSSRRWRACLTATESNSQHATHGSADASSASAFCTAAAQEIEVASLAQRVRAGVAQQHVVAVLARDAVDATHDRRIKRIAEVGNHREQQAAFRRAQIARELVMR